MMLQNESCESYTPSLLQYLHLSKKYALQLLQQFTCPQKRNMFVRTFVLKRFFKIKKMKHATRCNIRHKFFLYFSSMQKKEITNRSFFDRLDHPTLHTTTTIKHNIFTCNKLLHLAYAQKKMYTFFTGVSTTTLLLHTLKKSFAKIILKQVNNAQCVIIQSRTT